MPKKSLPRILDVKADDKPYTLSIRWDCSDEASTVDISSLIDTFKAYAALKDAPELFRSVHVGEYGTDIVWSDELDMSADTLWRLAREQAGMTMSAADFKKWRERHDYTLDDVAEVLGISRRMVAYYDHGDKPIPRVVALAALAIEKNPDTLQQFRFG